MRDVESTKEAEQVPELRPRRRTLRLVYSADEEAGILERLRDLGYE